MLCVVCVESGGVLCLASNQPQCCTLPALASISGMTVVNQQTDRQTQSDSNLHQPLT